MAEIKDFITVVPVGTDLIPVSQNGNTRNAKVEEIRDKALRTEVETARGTEVNLDARLDKFDTSLSEKANNIDNTRTTVNKTVTGSINELNTNKAPLSSPAFTGNATLNGKQLATTDLIEIDLPYNTGFSHYTGGDGYGYVSKIVKRSDKKGSIMFCVKRTDGSMFAKGFISIATLPEGFKSKYGSFGVTNYWGTVDSDICYTNTTNQLNVSITKDTYTIIGNLEYEVI